MNEINNSCTWDIEFSHVCSMHMPLAYDNCQLEVDNEDKMEFKLDVLVKWGPRFHDFVSTTPPSCKSQ